MKHYTPKKYLTSANVETILRISKRCLQYWDQLKLVNSSINGGKRKRSYRFKDLIQLKIIKSLRDQGVSLQTIRLAMERIRNESDLHNASFVNLRIATDGKNIYIYEKGKIWNATSGQLELFNFGFEDLVKDIEKEKIIEIPKNHRKLTIKNIFPKYNEVKKNIN